MCRNRMQNIDSHDLLRNYRQCIKVMVYTYSPGSLSCCLLGESHFVLRPVIQPRKPLTRKRQPYVPQSITMATMYI